MVKQNEAFKSKEETVTETVCPFGELQKVLLTRESKM